MKNDTVSEVTCPQVASVQGPSISLPRPRPLLTHTLCSGTAPAPLCPAPGALLPRASAPAGSAQGRGCPSDSPETAGLFPEPPRPGPSPSTATPNTACSTYSHDRFLSHAPEGEGFCLFRSLGCTPCPAQGLAHSRASLVNLMTKCHDCYPGIRALPLRVERPWRRPWPWPPVSDRGQSQALGQLRLASALEIWGSPARRLPRCPRSMLPPGSEPTLTSIPSPVACLLRFSCSRKGSEPPLNRISQTHVVIRCHQQAPRSGPIPEKSVCVCRGGERGQCREVGGVWGPGRHSPEAGTLGLDPCWCTSDLIRL